MHFVGIVFGCLCNLDQYWEEEEVEEYIYETKEEAIASEINRRKENIKWRKEKIKQNDPRSSEYQQWIDEHPKHNKRTAWKAVKELYKERMDKNGNILSTYNPNSQWDWYSIGGRWNGFLPLKKKDSKGEVIYCNESTVGEVDWDRLFKERYAPYCYVTPSGDWISREDTNWSTSNKEEIKKIWNKQFLEELKSYDSDEPVTVIDFHI